MHDGLVYDQGDLQEDVTSMTTAWWQSALTLAERAAMRRGERASQQNDPASAGGTSRANRWRSQRPFDRPGFLARRLQIDGLTEPEFDALVDALPPGVNDEAEPPRWAVEVERADAIAHEIARLHGGPNDASIDGQSWSHS